MRFEAVGRERPGFNMIFIIIAGPAIVFYEIEAGRAYKDRANTVRLREVDRRKAHSQEWLCHEGVLRRCATKACC